MTKTHYTLVIDQGGQSTRALVFSNHGQILVSKDAPVAKATLDHNKHVEFDPEAILQTSQVLIQQVAELLSPAILEDLNTAAVISQRSSILACNKQGKPLGDMISWQDTRNADWLERQQWDSEAMQQQIGLRPNAHMGASKIRYLMDNNKTIQKALTGEEVVFMPWGAWLLQQLSKNPFRCECDPILASRMGLVALGGNDWSSDLLDRYGIPRFSLPRIVPSIHDHGLLQVGDKAVPLRLLGGDQNFIPYAYGQTHIENSLFINLGTGGFIQSLARSTNPSALPSLSSLLCSPIAVNSHSELIHEDRVELLLEGTINAAANSIEWWQNQLSSPYSYQALDEILQADSIDPSSVPIFINTLWGSGSPYWINQAHCEFIGPKTDYTQLQKTRAVLESILFACKVNMDLLQKNGGQKSQGIISGGLSQSDSLCQTLANITGISILRYSDQEASARGAVFYLNAKMQCGGENHSLANPQCFTPQIDKNTQAQLQRFEEYKNKMEALAMV